MEICKERRLTGKDKKRKKEKRKKEETSVSAYNMGFKYKPVYKARDLLHKFKGCQEKIEKKSKNRKGC